MPKNKLEELLEQCSDSEMTKPWPLIDSKKLAQLILDECIQTLEDKLPDPTSYFEEDNNQWVGGYKRGVNDCISSINNYLLVINNKSKENDK